MTVATLARTEELYTSLDHRLNSASNSLQDRFRALFTLKSLADDRAVQIISKCTGSPIY